MSSRPASVRRIGLCLLLVGALAVPAPAAASGHAQGPTGAPASTAVSPAFDASRREISSLLGAAADPMVGQMAYLKASTPGTDDALGSSIAISGDTIVVGVPSDDSAANGVFATAQTDNGAPDSGAAYVFTRSGAGWSQAAYLKSFNTNAGDHFGTSVAISGDTIVVGAPGEDATSVSCAGATPSSNTDVDSGAAYLFVHPKIGAAYGQWTQNGYLKGWGDAGERFGFSVAMSGTTVVVGAPDYVSGYGQATVFTTQASCATTRFYLTGDAGNRPGDHFGYAVAVDGDLAVVGAPGDDSAATGVNPTHGDNGSTDSGAAYAFTLSTYTSSWVPDAYLKASNTGAADGASVAMAAADALVVGATGEDSAALGPLGNQADDSATDSGAGYQFARAGDVWSQQTYVKASNSGAGDTFGTAVAYSGDTIAVGAPGEDSATGSPSDNGASNAGAAYVYVPLPNPTYTAPPSPTSAHALLFKVAFDEPVSGLAGTDFTVGGSAAGCTVLPVANTSPGTSSYVVGVTGCSTGTVSITLTPNTVTSARGLVGPAVGVTSPTITITPTLTDAARTAVAVSAGRQDACAVLADGSVRCWGSNDTYQLGGSSTGLAVPGLTSVVAVAAGFQHTCALVADGTIRCWGDNTYGQLGSAGASTAVPAAVPGISSAVALTANGDHTCVVIAAGTVSCWGRNDRGQLGGSSTTTSVPGGVSNVVALAAGGKHSCALLGSGTVMCWGSDVAGQVDGVERSTVLTATPAPGISSAVGLTAGGDWTCALLADTTVRCWGANTDGQLGNGTRSDSGTTVPAVVASLASATSITAGGNSECARIASGGIRCWGDNQYGQLGDGTTADSWVKARVANIGPGYATATVTANAALTNNPSYQVTFDRPVTGLGPSDFTVSGACTGGNLTGSGASYTLTLSGCGSGSVTVTLAANSVGDAALEPGPVAAVSNATVTVDMAVPTVTITAPTTPTNATTLAYTLEFSKPISGLNSSDLTVVETGTSCAISTPSWSGATWSVNLTGCGDGAVTLRLGAGAVTDAAGNTNAVATAASVVIDRTAPSTSLVVTPATSPTNGTSFAATATFSEPVTGFAAEDISLGGTSTGWSVSAFAGSGTSYTFTVSAASPTDGTLSIGLPAAAAVDAAGNPNTQAATQTRVIDRTVPTVTLVPAAVLTSDSTLAYTATFSEPVTGLGAGDFAVAGSATGCVVGTPAGGPTAWTVDLTGCSEGTVSLTLGAGSSIDAAGNAGPASAVVAATVTIDRTHPTVAVSGPAATTNAAILTFGLSFSESISGLEPADFSVAGTATGCAVGTPTGAGAHWAVALTGCGEGTLTLTLAANSVRDSHNVPGPSAVVSSAQVTIDRTGPATSSLVVGILSGVAVGTTSGQVQLTWTATDGTGSGIDHYTVETSSNGGTTWAAAVAQVTTPAFTASPSFGKGVRYRITAFDRADNASIPLLTATLTPSLAQQTTSAFKYGGTWKAAIGSAFSGGSVKYGSKAGASVTFKVTARAIGFITTRGKDRGAVKVYVNGKLTTTIDLRATATGSRWVAWSTSSTAAKAWTIKLVVVGSRGRPRVDIDGFVVVK